MSNLTKLTLSVDPRVVQKAKRIAKARGTSVSAMIGQLVDDLNENISVRDIPLGPLTKKAMGLAKLPPQDRGKSDEELITEALMERYGLK